jgi:glycosyltransferase involved in cell wall biosynthesis
MDEICIIFPGYPVDGGAPSVAVWAIQALRKRYKVSVISYFNWPAGALNQFFGTDLKDDDFQVIKPYRNGFANVLASRLPRTLNQSLICRFVKHKRLKGTCISMCGEFDFGRRGIQYIHFPFFSDGKFSTYELASIGCKDTCLKRLYRKACSLICKWSIQSIGQNLTLCNSEYTASVTKQAYGIDSEVLYPPVSLSDFSPESWEKKKDNFVMLGRIVPYKRQDLGIQAVERIRNLGNPSKLFIVGRYGSDKAYNHKIRNLAKTRPWVHICADVSRSELVELANQCRYGIHGMYGEHFGIAVVELVAAGCIPFVPDKGGQACIVQPERTLLTYSPGDLDGLVSKIQNIMQDNRLSKRVHSNLQIYVQRFSEKTFRSQLKRIIGAEIEKTPSLEARVEKMA